MSYHVIAIDWNNSRKYVHREFEHQEEVERFIAEDIADLQESDVMASVADYLVIEGNSKEIRHSIKIL